MADRRDRAPLIPAEASQVLELIRRGQAQEGRPPGIGELCRALGLPRMRVEYYLGLLVKADLIQLTPKRRSIRLVVQG